MDFDKYINHKPFLTLRRSPSIFRAYQDESFRLKTLFKQDALRDVGLTGHPKADRAFDVAWGEGHAFGFDTVHGWLRTLADLLLD